MVLPSLLSALKSGKIPAALSLLRDWLEAATPGSPEALLAECPGDMRPKLVLLMRDLLSRYPTTLLGAPVLLYCTPEDGAKIHPDRITLPYPTPESAQPCSELHFVGWVSCATKLPIPSPFRPEHHVVQPSMGKITSVVALFRSHPEVYELDQVELPAMWWGELFSPVRANIHLSSQMLLAYPDALEAARLMQASATGSDYPQAEGFLSETGRGWALDSGALFHETCRQKYPEFSARTYSATGRP